MDILIKDGLIIDGTGRNGYYADLLIKEDRVSDIGEDLTTPDCKIIDASNKVVAPGFIDMHSHADLTILKVNTAEAYLMQGVTTLVVSVCGIGLAPANDKVTKYYADFVTNLLGSEKSVLYDTLPDYFSRIEAVGISPNLVFFIPHGNVRASVLGIEERPPTETELEEMKQIVRDGMEAGAFGLSTGLVYPPGSLSTTDEIIALCQAVQGYGGIYDSHMRDEGSSVVSKGMGELVKIARQTGIQAQISHWKAGGRFAWKLTPQMISTIKLARDRGLKIYADMYPYQEASSSLSGLLLRPWVYKNFEKHLSNPVTRQKIMDEMMDMIKATFLQDVPGYIKILPKYLVRELIFWFLRKKIRIVSVMHNHHIEGMFLGDALKVVYPKKKLLEALLDFIRDEQGAVMATFKLMNERRSIFELIKQDFVAIGSDGFLVYEGNTHPRTYGCFAKVLENYVREKHLFSLEEGIRKMTGLPSQILGLKDRGIINKGKVADIVVFDPQTIESKATYENGTQLAEGIDHVIVNGEITVANGRHLGTLNGKILKPNRGPAIPRPTIDFPQAPE
jgi:N-acyl-D-amino-acid deacylase